MGVDQISQFQPNFTILEYLKYLEYLDLGQFCNFCDVLKICYFCTTLDLGDKNLNIHVAVVSRDIWYSVAFSALLFYKKTYLKPAQFLVHTHFSFYQTVGESVSHGCWNG